MTYAEAVDELYQAPFTAFVETRKRLAAALKTADKAGSAQLAKLARPTISAWTVNQLWWRVRDDFDAMLESATALRKGHLTANPAHRDAIAKLRARAGQLLTSAGHPATEATIRRVMTTVSAIAATGSFDPDPPGALVKDRDPPGFEAVGVVPLVAAPAPAPAPAKAPPHKKEKEPPNEIALAQQKRADAIAAAEAAAAERKAAAARAARKAERERVEGALRTAKGEVTGCERDLTRARQELEKREEALVRAQEVVHVLESTLASLPAPD